MINFQLFNQKSSTSRSHAGFVLLFSSLLLSSVFLSGCATTFNKKTGAFRNRELDYLHQPVSQNSALIIPPGIESRNMKPKNILPPGPLYYPAESSLDMTPPGFNQKVAVPATTPSTPSKKTVSNQTSNKNSQAIKDQIAQIQTQIQNLKKQQETITANSAMPEKSSETPATAAASLPIQISSTLTFDANNAGLLKINAPYAKAWEVVQVAIKQSGYQISKLDPGSHLIYLTEPAQGSLDNQKTFLLFINRKDNATQVSIFTDKGILDSSAEAYSLLSQLHSNLNSLPSS